MVDHSAISLPNIKKWQSFQLVIFDSFCNSFTSKEVGGITAKK